MPILTPNQHELQQNKILNKQIQELKQQFQRQAVNTGLLKQIGQQLWASIQNCESLALNADNPLALTLQINTEYLQNLPWECLYHPSHGFLAKHTACTFSRVHPTLTMSPSSKRNTPMHILFFTARTDAALAHDVEQYMLYQTLAALLNTQQVQLVIPDDGSFNCLVRLTEQYPWDVVILSGHGIINDSTGNMAIWFEHPTGKEAIDAMTLLNTLPIHTIHCMILAVCHSGQQLAYRLAQAGIPYVIGMREPLLDRAGQVFVRKFCQQFAVGDSIPMAVQRGRQAMTTLLDSHEQWHSTSAHDISIGQWTVPMLIAPPTNTAVPNIGVMTALKSTAALESPPLLIGRRSDLAVLTAILQCENPPHILVHGVGGIGKTTLLRQLLYKLQQLDHHSEQFASFAHFYAHFTQQNLAANTQIVWIDNIQATQELATLFALSKLPFCLLLTTRLIPSATAQNWYCHHLTAPDYQDFARYVRQLGLNYQTVQLRWLYHVLQGNFHGVQLLQNFPHCEAGYTFKQQINLVKRYLTAYQRAAVNPDTLGK